MISAFCAPGGRRVFLNRAFFFPLLVIFCCSPAAAAAESYARLRLDETVTSLAFGSCAFQWEEQQIWQPIAAMKPDVFVLAGDAIYADRDNTGPVKPTVASIRSDWREFAANPLFRAFRKKVPVLGIWDNHDYGTAMGGRDFPLREQSKAAFLDFLGEDEKSKRRERSGVYAAYVLGPAHARTQIILLDTRSVRQPPALDTRSEAEKERLGIVGRYVPDTSGSLELLGAAQWRWLEKQLLVPARFRLIVSGIQILPNEKGMDEWGNYPHERKRLLQLLSEVEGHPPVLLTGNVHFAELSRARIGERCITELTASGLTHITTPPAVGNRFRVGQPVAEPNFGFVSLVHDEEEPAVLLSVYDEQGNRMLHHTVETAGGQCSISGNEPGIQ